MPSEGPSRPYNWRPKSLAKLKQIIGMEQVHPMTRPFWTWTMTLPAPIGAAHGVCLRMRSGRNSLPVACGSGRHMKESMDERYIALKPVTQSSFPPLVTGSIAISTMRVPTATTGFPPSMRATRVARGAWASIPAMSTGAATAVTLGYLSVPSQNKSRARRKPARQLAADAASMKPSNPGRSPRGVLRHRKRKRG